ncbi:MAG: c-type cytochrome biogenesis protein CcmI [Rhodospirillales bacterium]
MIWVIATVLAAAAALALISPLLRAAPDVRPRAAYDLDAYAAQLRELERDLARGVIGEEQAEAARLEIQRRILAADKTAVGAAASDAAAAPSPGRGARGAVIAAAVIAPLIGFGVYGLTGSPGVPNAPFAERDIAAEESALVQERAAMIRAMVDGLAARLEDDPDDREGWIRLERAYTVLGEMEKAAYARKRAAEAQE